MSDYLPVSTRKHFRIDVKDEVQEHILAYCTDALLIPVGHLSTYDRVPDFDSWYVYVRSGARFIVSNQEVWAWENRKVCSPGREEKAYDQF